MVRYNNKIRHKEFPWGRIEFSSKQHITVITPELVVVFHEFEAPRGSYDRSWRLFIQEVRRRNLKSIYDIYKYSERYEVSNFIKSTRPEKRYENKIKEEHE